MGCSKFNNFKYMQLNLTKEQLKEMILAAMFYSWVRGGLADGRGEDFEQYHKLEEHLLSVAKVNGFNDLAENFRGSLLPSDEMSEQVEEIMSDYDDDTFWHELTMRLGKRDFWRTVSPGEEKEAEERGWLPERIHEIYKKYEDEFDEYDIGRLKIVED